MEFKHTPGPWEAIKINDGFAIKEDGLAAKGFSDRIAELYEYGEAAEFNAKLMAAAPELLEALIECELQLKLAQKRLSDSKSDDMKAQQYANARGRAQLAIDKAINSK